MKSENKSERNILYDIFYYWIAGVQFLRKCTKPNKQEYKQLLRAYIGGILFLGSLAYIIKLIHIPINNIIVGNKE
ncbi:protein translocase SEC61 complex gamma subunit, archaeal and eukaryotic [Anncaliia algerae PRA109]|nr:protein translocase SEC61 complex gamma subunit, archaeal and eukaryotic [Anncaliia algerae PRA109]